MNEIEYKIIDLDKVKTVDDIVLILKSLSDFNNIKCAKGKEWKTLAHLLGDEIYVQTFGVEE